MSKNNRGAKKKWFYAHLEANTVSLKEHHGKLIENLDRRMQEQRQSQQDAVDHAKEGMELRVKNQDDRIAALADAIKATTEWKFGIAGAIGYGGAILTFLVLVGTLIALLLKQ